MAKSGAPLELVQFLARHITPVLTFGNNAQDDQHNQSAALNT
ncbi:hypothetical protein [Tautonia rosea]|nr:hypothetical protein [Tautonia rosea]